MVNEEIVYVRIPAPLRNLTGENNKIEINLSNIDERQVKTLLDYVDKEFPGFKAKLFNPTGELTLCINADEVKDIINDDKALIFDESGCLEMCWFFQFDRDRFVEWIIYN